MRRLWRCAAVIGFLVATACGSAGPGRDTTLSAAGDGGPEPAPAVTSSTTEVTVTVPPATTTTGASSTTTVKRATTTTPTTAPRPSPPAPSTTVPSTTVAPDTVLGVSTAITQGTTTATMTAVREQYLGERVYVSVDVSSAEYISSVRIDFGDGYVTTNPQTQQPTPEPTPTMRGSAERTHIYPVAGRYRITVTVTVVPGIWAFAPTPLPGQWMATGPEHTVTVAADVLQRPDAAPPGYPRLPTLASE